MQKILVFSDNSYITQIHTIGNFHTVFGNEPHISMNLISNPFDRYIDILHTIGARCPCRNRNGLVFCEVYYRN